MCNCNNSSGLIVAKTISIAGNQTPVSLTFYKEADETFVTRAALDTENPQNTIYLDKDIVSGYVVEGIRYVEGVILDASNFVWPTDVDYQDPNANNFNTKFLITTDVTIP